MNTHRRRDVIFFTGAGASAWAGYRTFMNFPSMFWPSGNDPAKLEVAEKERHLLKEMEVHLKKRHLPLTLDWYLYLIHQYQQVTSHIVSHTILRERILTGSAQWASVQELRRLLMTLKNRICRLTALHYRRPATLEAKIQQMGVDGVNLDRKKIDTLYDTFRSVYGESVSEINIFTTNYDILPEYLFSDSEYFKALRGGDKSPFLLDNGFQGFDATSNFGEEKGRLILRGTASVEDEQDTGQEKPRIVVHRLHGCVSWLHGNLGDEKIYFDMRDPVQIADFPEKLCVSYPGHEQLYGRRPYFSAFQALADSFRTARIAIFVGFSFRDVEIIAVVGRSLYSRVQKSSTFPRFIVVDPQLTVEEIRERISYAATATAGPTISWSNVSIKIVSATFPSDEATAGILELIAQEGRVES